MAQVGIKSPEGYFFSLDGLAQAYGQNARVGGLEFRPLFLSPDECATEPPPDARPTMQPGIILQRDEVVLPVSVVQVSSTEPLINLRGR